MMMLSMTSISCLLVALGLVALVVGLVLLVKRAQVAGAIVALLGTCLIIFPVLTVLYVALVMR